jgi:hypothetical protein
MNSLQKLKSIAVTFVVVLITTITIAVIVSSSSDDSFESFSHLLDRNERWCSKNLASSLSKCVIYDIEETKTSLSFKEKGVYSGVNYLGKTTWIKVITYIKLDKRTGKGKYTERKLGVLGSEGGIIVSGEMNLASYTDDSLEFWYVADYIDPKIKDPVAKQGQYVLRTY